MVTLMSMPVYVGEPRPVYIIRWCRPKKKRIRKKWAKDRKHWRFSHYERYCYQLRGAWIVDPQTRTEPFRSEECTINNPHIIASLRPLANAG